MTSQRWDLLPGLLDEAERDWTRGRAQLEAQEVTAASAELLRQSMGVLRSTIRECRWRLEARQ